MNLKKLQICGVSVLLVACSNESVKTGNEVAVRTPSSAITIPAYDIAKMPAELGETWDPIADTAKATAIGDSLSGFITNRDKTKSTTNRTFHPKHHGCVKADFAINPSSLPEAYRVGVFSQAANYQSWIRFSNGDQNGENSPDLPKDVRGMAVKLLNVDHTPTGSQDFVMCTAKEFFAKGAADYVALNKIAVGGFENTVVFGIDWLTDPVVREDVAKAAAATIQIASPLETYYYSATPYKLGSKNTMKFFVQPCAGQGTHALPDPKTARPNYLSEVLQSSISAQSKCFDFLVQPNMNPGVQSIEDPRIVWDWKSSPAYKVATITIHADSDIHSLNGVKDRDNFCENLSFDPWHTQVDTRPVGEIGRVRGLLYQRMSTVRHTQNATLAAGALPEPRSLDNPCVGEEAKLCQVPHH